MPRPRPTMPGELRDFTLSMSRGNLLEAEGIATAFINAHPADFAKYEAMINPSNLERSVELLVHMVDTARAQGNDEEVAKLDAFLLARFKPRHIGVTVQVELKPVRS